MARPSFRLALWLLWLVPLFGTARPLASSPAARPNPPSLSPLAPQARAHPPGVGHERTRSREACLSVRAGAATRDRGLAEDPSLSGHSLLPPPGLRMRHPGARCASTPPVFRLGLGVGDLPPPAA